MKEVKVRDIKIDRKEAVVVDCYADQIVGSNIIDLIDMINNHFVIIATPWEIERRDVDCYNPHTWLLSYWFDHLPRIYTIQFDGWEYIEGIDCSERDYFHICGYTANKECIAEMEELMFCKFEFDLAYGSMYNFDEDYNIIKRGRL